MSELGWHVWQVGQEAAAARKSADEANARMAKLEPRVEALEALRERASRLLPYLLICLLLAAQIGPEAALRVILKAAGLGG